jgi:hypothetical protein
LEGGVKLLVCNDRCYRSVRLPALTDGLIDSKDVELGDLDELSEEQAELSWNIHTKHWVVHNELDGMEHRPEGSEISHHEEVGNKGNDNEADQELGAESCSS